MIEGVIGTGQEIGYFASTQEIVMVGNINNSYTADHIITAYKTDGSNTNRTIGKPLPADLYYMFLGNFRNFNL